MLTSVTGSLQQNKKASTFEETHLTAKAPNQTKSFYFSGEVYKYESLLAGSKGLPSLSIRTVNDGQDGAHLRITCHNPASLTGMEERHYELMIVAIQDGEILGQKTITFYSITDLHPGLQDKIANLFQTVNLI